MILLLFVLYIRLCYSDNMYMIFFLKEVIPLRSYELFFAFLMGFFLYALVEIAGRGYTHWTMCLTGGMILAVLYTISRRKAMPPSFVIVCYMECIFFQKSISW